jgi:rfaE bifunctional protein nucleotidyltransferase chain/domain
MDIKKKIVSLPALKKKLALGRKKKYKILFTNGCFDILHLGHVLYLEKAKKPNRMVIVGLNSDNSIKHIKGDKRPIVSQNERAYVLAGLESVDFVTIFNEATPQKLIEAVRPDILAKGADWKGKEVAGGEFVRSYGGKVEFIEYVKGHSSTDIIKKILETCQK